MNARKAIFERLQRVQPEPVPVPDTAAWMHRFALKEDSSQRTARLRSGLEMFKTEVHEVDAGNWADVLLALALAKGWRHLLIGAGTAHGEHLAALAPPALQVLRYSQPIEGWKDQLFDGVDAALTLARGAVADTGSLILWPSAAEPRLMSLVPSTHVVLLDAHTIHATLFDVMRAEGWAQSMPTNALLICGPSKTADIQQTLAYGAHGPRELIVLLRQSRGDDV